MADVVGSEGAVGRRGIARRRRRQLALGLVVALLAAGAGVLGAAGPAQAQAQEGDCHAWDGGTSLQRSLDLHGCTEVQPGTYTLDRYLLLPDGHTLQGNPGHPRDAMVLRAGPGWNGNGYEGVVNGTQPPHRSVATVRHLHLDGAGIATGVVGAGDMVVADLTVRGGRCWGVAIVAPQMTVIDSTIQHNGADPSCPGAPGAGIFAAVNGSGYGAYAPRIHRNEISHNVGPGVDVHDVWYGELLDNTIHDNASWAAVSLLGSRWTIARNTITHPLLDVGQPWLPACATGPAGAHAAAVFLCQATVAGGVSTSHNLIADNTLSGWYGVLLIGNDEANAGARPIANIVTRNTIVATVLPCADDGEAGGTWANAWVGCSPTSF